MSNLIFFIYYYYYLQELVLRDNKLTKVPDVSIFKSLLVFDVSFNEIGSLRGVSKVSNTLKELYVSKNEVTKMEEIEHLYQLQILELGSNRLRVSILHVQIWGTSFFLSNYPLLLLGWPIVYLFACDYERHAYACYTLLQLCLCQWICGR